MTWKRILALAVAMFLMAPLAMAQHKDWKSWYGEFSVAYTMPEISQVPDLDANGNPNGNTVDLLDNGWSLTGGAIYKPSDWPVGIYMELGYNTFDITREALNAIGVGGGDFDVWNLNGGLYWTTNTQSVVNFYIRLGVGMGYIQGQLTDPGVGFRPPYCNWYWCFPGGYFPADVVVASESTTRLAYNAGLGLSFTVGSDSEIYLEARYHTIQTSNESFDYIPISLGYRW